MKRMFLGVVLLSTLSAAPLLGGPFFSDAPQWVPIVGTQNGVPHAGFEVKIVVRDFLNTPVAGSNVVLDFSGMIDVRLCRATVLDNAGAINCAHGTIHATTDATGTVKLTVVGGSINVGTTLGHGLGEGLIYADGIPLMRFTSPILDQNGAVGGNGVNGADLSLSLADVNRFRLGGPYVGRSDHSRDTALSGADLSVLLRAVNQSALGGGSASGCANAVGPLPYCP